jgi:hypothetical protein
MFEGHAATVAPRGCRCQQLSPIDRLDTSPGSRRSGEG